MPSLDAMLEKNLRFIDYERIRDKNDVRLVAFGKFAGIAGTIDLLSYVGKFLLTKGYSTPFLNICIITLISFFIFSHDIPFYECINSNVIIKNDR